VLIDFALLMPMSSTSIFAPETVLSRVSVAGIRQKKLGLYGPGKGKAPPAPAAKQRGRGTDPRR
jgi:hypothetical protein